MRRLTLSLLVCAGVVQSALAGPFTATEMMKLKRLGDPRLSPDGKWVAYAATEVDLAAGTRNSDLWLIPAAGGEPRRLTTHPKSDSSPRWSPAGNRLAFLSNRDGASQVYLLNLSGGEPRKATALASGVDSFFWLDEQTLLAVSDTRPEGKAEPQDGSSARVYEHLLFRHWDSWEDGLRRHLLVVPLEGGEPKDLTPGDRDVPPFSLGGADVAVSPDGREVCFSRNDDPVQATSTNADLYVVATTGGEVRRVVSSLGYDGSPRYSPDGTRIAYRAQFRAGYEADRWRLLILDRRTGATLNLTEGFDRHPEDFTWSADGRTIFFTASEGGRQPLFAVPALGGPIRKLAEGTFSDLQASPDGRSLIVTKAAFTHPAEVYRLNVDGSGLTAVTHLNDAPLAGFGLDPGQSVTFKGAADKDVQAWVVKPPDFDPTKKYPLLVLIHGGPQGAWTDAWTYRWNSEVFAAAGYVVFAPNPRGSVGWGQEFEDDINGDWGGRAYEDIMKGTDFAEALPYVDKGRTVAAGASYGGYMVNWIAGHTDRFRALVSHDGVFDLVSMYGSTEELWFPEWEFKGPFWENPEMYRRWSPSSFVQNFKTPTLVVHGEQDFRLPLEQGLGMFTALQRKGVPSRLLVFPDENHWVLKPANSVRWYREVIGWLDRWTRK
jgi:dipeptidyl aminopeptidase/acylaminoacyl peptidase